MHYLKIDMTLSMPLYKQIIQSIQHAIDAHILRDGDLLPSESQYQSLFGVSSIVVKQAYQALAREGIVQSVRGKGTFLTIRPHLTLDYDVFSHHNRDVIGQDLRLMHASLLPIHDDQRLYFPDKKITHVMHLKHVGFVNGYPMYYRDIQWSLPSKKERSFTILSLSDCLSLLTPEQRLILSTELVYYPSLMNEITASLLNVPVGDPIHFIRTDFMLKDQRLGVVYHTFPSRFVTLRRES
jgi:DNA-binding GntR family transcriptional regulator